ncbi:2-dehydro-3-deoxygalactonokinase [Vibrio scophthalmi]|uniref:2-dehydro-3-deoxygalactonokinase n=1 Tax=Vibrio scophthalmi TaxID=45658 RepID=UPI0022852362|nr:2-dehydro-3-deoxygalactonokinase [Vibrio scophthalmi]MCY9802596.1 2-dehydro-3-deoxygalactonokinase [Vibrio scophthalmi]
MTKKSLIPSWIAVDWGTSNFRAFLMTEDGLAIDKITASCGLLAVPDGLFSETFRQLTSPWAGKIESLPVLLGGMVGSQQGWCDVPYASLPVSIHDLSENLVDVELPWGQKGWIVPGAAGDNQFEFHDVMRGEEIQLMGLAHQLGQNNVIAILPGTHSKHARIKEQSLISFQTYMTGELFSILKQHSILGRQLPEQHHSKNAFLKGVDAGRKGLLSAVIFSARTERLFNHISSSNIESYLSGILIGAELSAISTDDLVYIVGDEKLCTLYQTALVHIGLKSKILSGDDCFLSGLTTIYQKNEGMRNVA